MFGKLFEDTVAILSDAAKVATLPVALTVGVTREVTRPVADMAEEAVKDLLDPEGRETDEGTG